MRIINLIANCSGNEHQLYVLYALLYVDLCTLCVHYVIFYGHNQMEISDRGVLVQLTPIQ